MQPKIEKETKSNRRRICISDRWFIAMQKVKWALVEFQLPGRIQSRGRTFRYPYPGYSIDIDKGRKGSRYKRKMCRRGHPAHSTFEVIKKEKWRERLIHAGWLLNTEHQERKSRNRAMVSQSWKSEASWERGHSQRSSDRFRWGSLRRLGGWVRCFRCGGGSGLCVWGGVREQSVQRVRRGWTCMLQREQAYFRID